MATDGGVEFPPLLPYPPKHVKTQLSPEEWDSSQSLWIVGLESRTALRKEQFEALPTSITTVHFLLSYLKLQEWTKVQADDEKAVKIRLLCRQLIKRLLASSSSPLDALAYFKLLSISCRSFSRSKKWVETVKVCWQSNMTRVKKAIETAKTTIATSDNSDEILSMIERLSWLTKVLPEVAPVTLAGADYLDIVTESFDHARDQERKILIENVYCSFVALLQTKHPTTLTDNLYHMKSEADRRHKQSSSAPTLLSALLCTTTLLKHLRSSSEIANRRQALLNQLDTYRIAMAHVHPLPARQNRSKGKAKAEGSDEVHVHRASLISQVHELFPQLSTAYVMKALDFYEEKVEDLIAALLEPETLPPSLQDLEAGAEEGVVDNVRADLVARSTPPLPSRPDPNSIDADFDHLQLDPARLRRGKKQISVSEATTSHEQLKAKAAILSALAAFDSDDDERDDTYDVADVGGAVDNTLDTDERRTPTLDTHEAILFKTWQETPDLFSRDSKTRASNMRQQLKRETELGDEQIEGWAIMLGKDKKLQDRLQEKYSAARAFGGQQRALQATKWQASTSTENSESEGGPERSNDSRRMGQAGIRGHRTFNRGRGRDNTANPTATDRASTQLARKRKEQGRGRGGSNQRRDARAKKIGAGMGPLPPS